MDIETTVPDASVLLESARDTSSESVSASPTAVSRRTALTCQRSTMGELPRLPPRGARCSVDACGKDAIAASRRMKTAKSTSSRAISRWRLPSRARRLTLKYLEEYTLPCLLW